MICGTTFDIPLLASLGLNPALCNVVVVGFTGGGDTFDCYKDEAPIVQELKHGSGWTGNWVVSENYTGLGANSSGIDTFETYSDGQEYGLVAGSGWVGPWVSSTTSGGARLGYDTFESYDDGPTSANTSYNGASPYSSFTNWDDNLVNLLGNGHDDIFPGNDLYVELYHYANDWETYPVGGVDASSITTKDGTISLDPGDYQFQFDFLGIEDYFPPPATGGTPTINITITSSSEGVIYTAQSVLSYGHNYYSIPITIGATGDIQIALTRGNANPAAIPYVNSVGVIRTSDSAVMFYDDFSTENAVAGQLPYGGVGWVGSWIAEPNYLGVQTTDDFEDEESTGDLSGGYGWAGDWTVEDVYPTLAAVTASPTSGAPPQTVTLSHVTSGVDIYYTTDGSTPTTSSTLYTGAISISSDTTLKAFAVKTGYKNGPVSSWNYLSVVGDWANRVVTNGGAAPSNDTKTALTTFWNALITAGIDSKMIAVNAFVPDSLTAALTPLYKTAGNDPWTNHSFVSGDLSTSGLQGNGSKYLGTGIIPSTTFPSDKSSAGISLYVNTNTGGGPWEAGAFQGSGSGIDFAIDLSGNAYFDCFGYGVARISGANSGWTGFITANNTSNTARAIHKAKSSVSFTSVASTTSQNNSGGSLPTIEIQIFNLNGASPPTNRRISFAAIHLGLTAAEAQALYNAVQQLRTDLGGGYL